MRYVIGDVHGCYDELMMLLQKIEEKDSDAQIIFVGDFIDRGPKVWDVLLWMMEHITEDGKYQSVRGNHEEMVLEWYKEYVHWYQQMEEGKALAEEKPLTTYDFDLWAEQTGNLSPEKLAPIMKFFESLPLEKKILIQGKEDIIFRIVHAWTTFDAKEDDQVEKEIFLWKRHNGGNCTNDDIVIHGHTPTISSRLTVDMRVIPGLIAYWKNEINIDCGCCFAKSHTQYLCMLGAICLETMEEIYAMTVEERMAQMKAALLQSIPKEYHEEVVADEVKEYMKLYGRKGSVDREKVRKRILV